VAFGGKGAISLSMFSYVIEKCSNCSPWGRDVSFACFNFPKIAWQKCIFFHQLWTCLVGEMVCKVLENSLSKYVI
jgi:hypothetical protein